MTNGKPERSNSVTSETARSRLITTSLKQHFSESATIYPTIFLNTECVNSFEAHGSSVTDVKFNMNGTFLVTSGLDRLVKIWNLNGSCLKTLSDHTRYVNCCGVNVSCIKFHSADIFFIEFSSFLSSTPPSLHRVPMISIV